MRGYQSYRPKKQYIDMPERFLSAGSYLTSGLVGFVWLIIAHLKRQQLSSFAKYNIFQSILLSIIVYLASILLNIIGSVMSIIPFLGTLVVNIIYYLIQYPLIGSYSPVQIVLIGTYIYLAIFALTGRRGQIPYVSDMVKQMG